MGAIDVAERYFAAWNARDPDAVAAAFDEGGTYRDPLVPDGLDAAGTAAYARGLWDAFPDLSFAVDDLVADGDRVWARWTMTGTNHGPFNGLPPTGRAIATAGADLVRTAPGGVAEVQGFFDSGAVPRQLGLQVIVQPAELGPFRFGTSTYVASGGGEPGAMSLTVLEAPEPDDREEVRNHTRAIMEELIGTPGFISWVSVQVGPRMYTMTAWEKPEDADGLGGNASHRQAAKRFFSGEVARGGQTGVWTPHRLNGMWTRCEGCRVMVRAEEGRCPDGHELPEPIAYW